MNDIVLKAFKSTDRCFAVGDPIGAGDDIAPHDYGIMTARGFIGQPGAAPTPVAETAPRIPLGKSALPAPQTDD